MPIRIQGIIKCRIFVSDIKHTTDDALKYFFHIFLHTYLAAADQAARGWGRLRFYGFTVLRFYGFTVLRFYVAQATTRVGDHKGGRPQGSPLRDHKTCIRLAGKGHHCQLWTADCKIVHWLLRQRYRRGCLRYIKERFLTPRNTAIFIHRLLCVYLRLGRLNH
jgi:hypothetical protein